MAQLARFFLLCNSQFLPTKKQCLPPQKQHTVNLSGRHRTRRQETIHTQRMDETITTLHKTNL